MFKRTSFYLQNYPCSYINKWFPYHQENTHNKGHNKHVLFCLPNISNHFFMRQFMYKTLFLNLYMIDNLDSVIDEMTKFIHTYCESALLMGDCSENEVYVDCSDKKLYLLREYKDITFNNFDNNWFNYVLTEHGYYDILNKYMLNIPFSYIWLTHFTQVNENALILDDTVDSNYAILKKFMHFVYEEEDKKYPIVIWNGLKHKADWSEIFAKVEKNGVCLVSNTLFNIATNTIGWHDVKNKLTGFIKV